jgi:outer membrane autotransporter protein
VRSASVCLRADLWHEFLGQPTTEFSSADGFIPFTADLQGSWFKVGPGGTYDLSTAATLYGNVSYDARFDEDAWAWEGKLGFKVKW